MIYVVTWVSSVTADSPEAAAKAAVQMMRDPKARATVIDVVNPDTGREGVYDASVDPARKIY